MTTNAPDDDSDNDTADHANHDAKDNRGGDNDDAGKDDPARTKERKRRKSEKGKSPGRVKKIVRILESSDPKRRKAVAESTADYLSDPSIIKTNDFHTEIMKALNERWNAYEFDKKEEVTSGFGLRFGIAEVGSIGVVPEIHGGRNVTEFSARVSGGVIKKFIGGFVGVLSCNCLDGCNFVERGKHRIVY